MSSFSHNSASSMSHCGAFLSGDLYKLSMKIDDVEQRVQENVKQRSSSRVPFKADHSINVNAMRNGKDSETERTGMELPPNR